MVAEQHEEIIDYKAKYEEAQKSIEALASKKEQLLNETKKAKEERARQAAAAELARKEQLEVAQKNGEFEKLWKQEQQEKNQSKTSSVHPSIQRPPTTTHARTV